MKKLVLLLMVLVSLFAGEIDINKLKDVSFAQKDNVHIIKAYDHGSLYELELKISTPRGDQFSTAFVTKDKKAIIFGEAFDMKTMQSLQIPLDSERIKNEADLVFGSGKDEYFLFTDPECHYCNVFERAWPKIEKDVKIYVYYMPLSHHREAKAMTYYIMQQSSQHDKAQVSIRMANGDNSYKKAKITQQEMMMFNAKLEKNSAFSQKMGVRGTPSLFDFKGNSINWSRLVQ